MRDVLLRRVSDFQGFGFHLQYNKVYYLVQRVEAGSPAENGGLRPNDVILSINQQSTTGMIHERFVEIVNGNTNVTFLVQSLEDYLRANPQRVRTQPTIPTVTAAPPIEPEKPKSSLSKALGKLTNR
jgi:C-terminal processing protease CtpA/Prc